MIGKRGGSDSGDGGDPDNEAAVYADASRRLRKDVDSIYGIGLLFVARTRPLTPRLAPTLPACLAENTLNRLRAGSARTAAPAEVFCERRVLGLDDAMEVTGAWL